MKVKGNYICMYVYVYIYIYIYIYIYVGNKFNKRFVWVNRQDLNQLSKGEVGKV